MRNPTFSVKMKLGRLVASVHQSDSRVAVELVDVGFWYWLLLFWVRITTFDTTLPDTSWLAILAAITFLCPFSCSQSPCCARGKCWGWSSYILHQLNLNHSISRLWLFFNVRGIDWRDIWKIVKWSRTSQKGGSFFCRVSLGPTKIVEFTIKKILIETKTLVPLQKFLVWIWHLIK